MVLITLQGILAPKAGVPVRLTSGAVVNAIPHQQHMSDINYGFTGVEDPDLHFHRPISLAT